MTTNDAGDRPELSDSNDIEHLRNALVVVEHLRRDEANARKEAQALLTGLTALTDATSVEAMLIGILEVIDEAVPLDEAAMLIESSDGRLTRVASTSPDLLEDGLPLEGAFQRVVAGKGTAIVNLKQIEPWTREVDEPFLSALCVPLETPSVRGMFLCLHEDPGMYTRRHVNVLTYFAPLAAQALKRAEDMAERNQMIRKLEHLAGHDTLTGAANRSLLSNRLSEAMRHTDANQTGFGLLHIDVDDFKAINDTIGHDAGDRVLQNIAQRCRAAVPDTATVARIGGDEFVVLLPLRNEVDEIREVAEAILDSLKQKMIGSVEPRVSIGISRYPTDATSAEGLLSAADLAMYRAKAEGGATVHVFDEALRAEHETRKNLEREINRALRNGEFVLHYQPIFKVGTAEPIAREALIRWEHPQRGRLSPAEFLSLAEQTGQIIAIGEWVLETALAQSAEWLQEDPERRIAINASTLQLLDRSFFGAVKRLAAKYGVRPANIELELSEEVGSRHAVARVMAGIQDLADIGVNFAFDDFGTGYSSIEILRTFPGHRLKIDRQFVSRMTTEETDAAIVRGMIGLGHGLGMEIVAEGVEHIDQVDALVRFGCDELQGFYLGRPAPLETAETREDGPAAADGGTSELRQSA